MTDFRKIHTKFHKNPTMWELSCSTWTDRQTRWSQ